MTHPPAPPIEPGDHDIVMNDLDDVLAAFECSDELELAADLGNWATQPVFLHLEDHHLEVIAGVYGVQMEYPFTLAELKESVAQIDSYS